MKLKNFHKDNYNDINECIVRGQIEMTQQEWELCRKYLIIKQEVAEMICNTYQRDHLPDTAKLDDVEQLNEPFVIGITGTQAIVDLFDLDGYKAQNYQILVI